jgi:HEPN domain-containing protein
MPNRADFKLLADRRLNEAKTLSHNKHYEAAFYLAGYAVECGLKAAVCKTLNIDIFNMSSELNRGFKTHRIDHLIVLAGLSKQLAVDASSNTLLAIAQNTFVNPPSATDKWQSWSEEVRYNVEKCDSAICDDFVNNVEQFLTWLRLHW